jgi:hypothetical protein
MQKPSINLFALPSQTSILFWLITATLLGAMSIGLMGAHIIPMWPLALVLFFLPLREFIIRPSREIRQRGLKVGRNDFPTIQQTIRLKAEQIGLKYVPQLLIDEKQGETFEMGSFRHWYVVLGVKSAQKLEFFLANPQKISLAEVQILHELYHFKNGDYWQLGYLAELFKVSFILFVWVLLFWSGLGILLILARDAFFQFSISGLLQNIPAEVRPVMEKILPSLFPSATEMEVLRIKVQGINLSLVLAFIANISVPYIILTAVLWLFYRPLLWRVREFYADAGVVAVQKSITPFMEFIRRDKQVPLQAVPAMESLHHPSWIQEALDNVWKFLRGDFWPDFSKRAKALRIPESIFYNRKQIVWVLGILVLLLEIFLATPLALPVYGQNPMIFPTLVTVAGLVYFLLPQVILGKNAIGDGLRVLIVLLLIRTVWLFLTLGLLWGLYFIQPSLLWEVLQMAISSTARYAGIVSVELDLFGFMIEASTLNLLQVPIIFIVQAITVSGLLFLFKRVMYWYSFVDTPYRFKQIVFGLTFGLLLVLLTLIMPIGMAVLKSESPSMIRIFFGLAVFIGGAVWFYVKDRRYYQNCPSCHSVANELPTVGAVCPKCQIKLFSWLVTDYE